MNKGKEAPTKVLFLREKHGDGVFAYFPEEVHDAKNKMCYAHIGQHSACSPEYTNECEQATFKEYEDLEKELISMGYSLTVQNDELRRDQLKAIIIGICGANGVNSSDAREKIAEALVKQLEDMTDSVEGLFNMDEDAGEQPNVVVLPWV